MRLTDRQRQIIIAVVRKHFGQNAVVWLFGSRVDDCRQGGDIDILVQPENEMDKDLFIRKIRALSELKRILGDRKIDVVVEHKNDTRSIIRKAHSEGMRL